METIELKCSRVSLRDDGIMHVHIKKGDEMELMDAIQVVEAIGKLGNSKKFPILIDCDEFSSVDKEVRTFAASEDANIYTSADAIAYHSLAHHLTAKFYVNHNQPKVPTQIFPNNDEAIGWLKTFL